MADVVVAGGTEACVTPGDHGRLRPHGRAQHATPTPRPRPARSTTTATASSWARARRSWCSSAYEQRGRPRRRRSSARSPATASPATPTTSPPRSRTAPAPWRRIEMALADAGLAAGGHRPRQRPRHVDAAQRRGRGGGHRQGVRRRRPCRSPRPRASPATSSAPPARSRRSPRSRRRPGPRPAHRQPPTRTDLPVDVVAGEPRTIARGAGGVDVVRLRRPQRRPRPRPRRDWPRRRRTAVDAAASPARLPIGRGRAGAVEAGVRARRRGCPSTVPVAWFRGAPATDQADSRGDRPHGRRRRRGRRARRRRARPGGVGAAQRAGRPARLGRGGPGAGAASGLVPIVLVVDGPVPRRPGARCSAWPTSSS